MRVFVTGGSGYVGRNLVRALVARGDEVWALARSDAAAAAVERVGARPVRGALDDAGALARGCAGCGLVVHAAADVTQMAHSDAQVAVNVAGTRAVFAAAQAAGVRRAVHVSTENVLNAGRPLVRVDETWPIPERHAGGYSRSKAEAERAALGEGRGGLEVVVVRPRLVWGRDDTSVMPALVDATRSGRLVWFGGGRYLTSTAHVANVIDGLLLAAERGRPGEVYFLTDGEPVEFRWFVTQLLATQGVPAPTRSVPRWAVRALVVGGEAVAALSGGRIRPPLTAQEYASVGMEMTVVDAKARRELGYAPRITVEAGLEELRAGRW